MNEMDKAINKKFIKVNIEKENLSLDRHEAEELMNVFKEKWPDMMDSWLHHNTEMIVRPDEDHVDIRLKRY